MTVIDSSALIAILRREPEADAFLRVIAGAGTCLLSSVCLRQTSLVLGGRAGGAPDWAELDALIARAGMQVVPQSADQVETARNAFLQYGKGRHPAGLNLGDCASYALAKIRNLPLLFKGNDFPQTDLPAAISPAVTGPRSTKA